MPHNTQSVIPTPCPQCGGERALTKIQGPYADHIVLIRPGFDPPKSPLIALTCVNCGLTQLYATQPHRLVPDDRQ